MNFGRVIETDCIVSTGGGGNTPVDPRCSDPAFAISNPGICGTAAQLIIKPASALACLLGSIQFRAFIIQNGQEIDVTASTVFSTSNPDVAVVGATSGNATGLSGGEAVITATYNSLTAKSDLTVFGEANCCDELKVGMMVLIDTSKSMSQVFGGSYSTKMAYAKFAAKSFINGLNEEKDVIGLISFNDSGSTLEAALNSDSAATSALVDTILETGQLTGFNAALVAAIAQLNSITLDEKVILLISDGIDTSTASADANDAIATINAFKAAGGTVLCLGVRAATAGFNFLEAISTGGFFLNAYDAATAASASGYINGLKGYFCAGNCVPAGDDLVAKGQFNYCGFENWNVVDGNVDLLGNGFLDFLPGNGLYVELAGNNSPHKGKLQSKSSFHLLAAHDYKLSLNLAGNQRVNDTPNTVNMRAFARNNDSLPDPSDAPSVVVNESGGALGDTPTYKYVYAYVNAYGQTISSPVTAVTPTTVGASMVITVPNPIIGLTVSGAGSPAVDGEYAYVTGGAPIVVGSQPATTTYYLHSSGLYAIVFDLGNWFMGVVGGASLYHSDSQDVTGTWGFDDGAAPAPTVILSSNSPPITAIRIYRTTGETPDSPFYQIAEIPLTNPTYTDFMDEADMLAAIAAGTIDICLIAPTENTTASQFDYLNQSVSINNYLQGFTPQSFTFTAPVDATVWIEFHQTDTPPSAPSAGLLLDSVSFDDVTDITNLLTDNFDTENETYIPPACGVGTHWVKQPGGGYGYSIGYSCYGEGCLDTPPPMQLPDPNPLVNIEAGFTPPVTFNSTKQACVSCPSGQSNFSNQTLFPPMTSNTAPIGEASDDTGSPSAFQGIGGLFTISIPAWIQYKFNSPTTISAYSFALFDVLNSAQYQITSSDFTLEGSSDGITWTTLDSQTGISWTGGTTGSVQLFSVAAPQSFLYVRLNFSAITHFANNPATNLTLLKVFGSAPVQVCSTQSASSEISQGDADTKALAAATAAATVQLNCVPSFTATESFTASCPLGQSGQSVTKTATVISFVSLADAQSKALASATAQANAALVCACGDTSAAKITINDNAPATPYPSVLCVTGKTGLITKVTVSITGFAHSSPADAGLILMSPDGTLVELMRSCGGLVCGVTNKNITFDDAAGSSLPDTIPDCSNPIASGTFKPTQFGSFTAFPLPCPSGVPATTLTAFIGEDANGSWLLFVRDNAFFNSGQISGGFTLNITTA